MIFLNFVYYVPNYKLLINLSFPIFMETGVDVSILFWIQYVIWYLLCRVINYAASVVGGGTESKYIIRIDSFVLRYRSSYLNFVIIMFVERNGHWTYKTYFIY